MRRAVELAESLGTAEAIDPHSVGVNMVAEAVAPLTDNTSRQGEETPKPAGMRMMMGSTG